MKLKRIILGMLMLCAAAAFSSCDDWTENEKIAVENPVFGEAMSMNHVFVRK